MRVKIDWANLMVGSKFTVFALFYFVFYFQVQAPGGLIFNEGFFAVPDLEAYIWRDLFSECYGSRVDC